MPIVSRYIYIFLRGLCLWGGVGALGYQFILFVAIAFEVLSLEHTYMKQALRKCPRVVVLVVCSRPLQLVLFEATMFFSWHGKDGSSMVRAV